MQQFARTVNLDIAYLESGASEGPPVILLHGWPSDVHDWDEVVPPLAAAGYCVLAPWLCVKISVVSWVAPMMATRTAICAAGRSGQPRP